ncbi:hypothetical protein BOTBODRAFT_55107 [Botryobasidium botryosum FD-172 SS1]|uniref:Uncharacterized protein n=1 Tax=Botryobasidium botryosum (strain FD-172 SS1) TaxID=930990 RepID=A0A067MJN6_BOTB1|nr:hypothetical protein BOTBODRAFT_55107 [Botryobasidium botryosum FD-172 SS1]
MATFEVHGEPGLWRGREEAKGPRTLEQELVIAGDFGGHRAGERRDCVEPAVGCGGAQVVRCGQFSGEELGVEEVHLPPISIMQPPLRSYRNRIPSSGMRLGEGQHTSDVLDLDELSTVMISLILSMHG